MSRKFKSFQEYAAVESEYFLLPFRFHPIDGDREVLVNEVGDYLICPRGTATRVAERDIVKTDDLYADLLARYFISEKPIPDLIDILATRYRTKKSFLDAFTSLHIFVVTLRCNHSCHYCQVSRQTEDKEEYDISLEDLDRAIELMMRSPSQEITMEFQGGEPLLAFDKVRYGVERTLELNKAIGKKITFVICTNITVLSDEILAFCKAHNILISTSLDGPGAVHNQNRTKAGSDSYERVIEGIRRTREVLGHDRVSALMTTTRLSLDYPIEIIDCYVEHGFSSIFLRPISPYGFALRSAKKNKYETERFLEFYKIGLEHILALNRKGLSFSEDFASIILKKMLTPFPVGYVDLQSPAGLINNVIVFNYDGGVYATDEARMLAENGDHTFRLGSVHDTYPDLFYGEKAQTLAQHWSNESLAGCSECGFQTYCGADPVFHHATQGDFEGYRPTSAYCTRNMEIIRFLFELMDRDRETEHILRSWIN